eukprot:6174340-Pleurochrysis_carterae.AAC.2
MSAAERQTCSGCLGPPAWPGKFFRGCRSYIGSHINATIIMLLGVIKCLMCEGNQLHADHSSRHWWIAHGKTPCKTPLPIRRRHTVAKATPYLGVRIKANAEMKGW